MNSQSSMPATDISDNQQNIMTSTLDTFETMTDENASNNFTRISRVNHLVEHDYCIHNDSRPNNILETCAIDSSKTISSTTTPIAATISSTTGTTITPITPILPSTRLQDTTRLQESSMVETPKPSIIFNSVIVQEKDPNKFDSSSGLTNFENLRERELMASNFASAHSMNDSLSDSSSQASTSALVIDSSFKKNMAKDNELHNSANLTPASPFPVSSTRRSQRQMERGGRRSFRNFDDEDVSQDSSAQIQSKSRARQLVSVTDKSEWITGEDQIDSIISQELGEPSPKRIKESERPRNKMESFNLSPPNYTSDSDAGSDDDSEYDPDSDNDPDKLWCLCRQPHNNKFMICCDVCKDWFHGHCVNVTKLMGARIEKEGREWFCPECTQKIKSGIPRSSIQKKPTAATKQKKNRTKPNKISKLPSSAPTSTVKRGRGRPRKSGILPQDNSQAGKLSISLKDGVGQIKQQITEPPPAPRPIKKLSSSLDPKLGVDNGKLKKKLARMDARNESFDEYEESLRLKRLIKERKREFFAKHKLIDQEKQAKRSQLGVGKQTITSSLGDSLDSLVSSTSVPNIDSSTKNELALNSKPNIVLQISTSGLRNQDSSISEGHDSTTRIVTLVRSPNKKSKHREAIDPSVDDLFKAEPLQIPKKLVSKTRLLSTDISSPGPNQSRKFSVSSIDSPSISESAPHRRRSDSGSSSFKNNRSPTAFTSPSDQSPTPLKKAQPRDKESHGHSPINGTGNVQNAKDNQKGSIDTGKTESTRQIVRKTIRDTLNSRCKDISDFSVPSDTIESIAGQIEDQLNECFREGTSNRYLNRYRSLIFNLRDSKNQGLLRKVLTSEISPQKLVRMSPEELASTELAKWRERENKHSLELIKRDARLAAQQVILKKTHKGEEVISGPTEAEEPSYLDEPNLGKDETSSEESTGFGTNQNIDAKIKTTAGSTATSSSDPVSSKKITKTLNTTTTSNKTPQASTKAMASNPVIIKLPVTGVKASIGLHGISTKPDSTSNRSSSSAIKQDPKYDNPILLIDTTRDHKTHIFDINCKICTKATDDTEESAQKRVSVPTSASNTSTTSSSPSKDQQMDAPTTTNSLASEQPKRICVSIDDSKILQEAAKYSSMMPPISSNESSPIDTSEPASATRTPNIMSEADDDNIESNVHHTIHLDDDDDDDLYDPDSPIEPTSGSISESILINEQGAAWRGTITMPEVAQFEACAHSVSGDVTYMKSELGDSLQVCGRIVPDQVEDYIGKLRNSTRAEIMIVQLMPRTERVRDGYDAFFDYLDSRNRYGVIGVNPKILKDFYILPIGKHCDVPDWLLPFNGPGIQRRQIGDNILLAILVRPRRLSVAQPPATNPASSELPVHKSTPINRL